MKSYVYHRSTKVCILKNKTNINMKLAQPSAHLGLVQFETDITNLSLQVRLVTFFKSMVHTTILYNTNQCHRPMLLHFVKPFSHTHVCGLQYYYCRCIIDTNGL